MKASDIQIGDWLRLRYTYRDTGREVIKDFRVAQIRCCGNDGPLYAWSEKGNMGYVEDLEPIPITDNILQNNGFKLCDAKPTYLKLMWGTGAIDEFADVTLVCGEDSNGNWRWDCLEMKIHFFRGDIHVFKIGFVHQLQHYLRNCGIEKEIVL